MEQNEGPKEKRERSTRNTEGQTASVEFTIPESYGHPGFCETVTWDAGHLSTTRDKTYQSATSL